MAYRDSNGKCRTNKGAFAKAAACARRGVGGLGQWDVQPREITWRKAAAPPPGRLVDYVVSIGKTRTGYVYEIEYRGGGDFTIYLIPPAGSFGGGVREAVATRYGLDVAKKTAQDHFHRMIAAQHSIDGVAGLSGGDRDARGYAAAERLGALARRLLGAAVVEFSPNSLRRYTLWRFGQGIPLGNSTAEAERKIRAMARQGR